MQSSTPGNGRPDGTLSKDVPTGQFVTGKIAKGSFSGLMDVTQYDDEELEALKDDYLRAYYAIGYKIKSCFEVGVGPKLVNGWLEADADFREKFDVITEYHTEDFRVALKRRAVEGVEEDVYFQGRVVGTKINYSDILLIVELKRRDPQYRERAVIENNVVTKMYQNIDDSEI